MSRLRVIVIKPSKYDTAGYVERFRWGYMPNSTLNYIQSLTPARIGGHELGCEIYDEVTEPELKYLDFPRPTADEGVLVALVGIQSHQFHRALDIAALARQRGCQVVLGGPHIMTCDTSAIAGRGVSVATAEADLVWPAILRDALEGSLQPSYGAGQRWADTIESSVLVPPPKSHLGRHVVPMIGLYPARGCPFRCSFCSVIQIAGTMIRSQPVATTMESLRVAAQSGIKLVMFTSDNFNKYPEAPELLDAIIEERLDLKFFVQCDTQVGRQPELVAQLARAGCFQIFLGIESFDRATLKAAHKTQNHPDVYRDIVTLCESHGVDAHFSNIIGFPNQDAKSIREQVDILMDLHPAWASFYVLCPIPGTEQYGDFLRQGLITETNLDRFDTSCLTWKHPHLSSSDLTRALFQSYRRFYGPMVGAGLAAQIGIGRDVARAKRSFYAAVFQYGNTLLGHHPMAGGVWRRRWDHAKSLRELRRNTYGFDYAPLPENLVASPGAAGTASDQREGQSQPGKLRPSFASG